MNGTAGLGRLGVIGNGTFGAIINQYGRCVWACPSHFGGDPIFNSLLNNHSDQTGFYDVMLSNFAKSEQTYVRNSGVLYTKISSSSNEVIEIHDFIPRFMLFNRVHDPFQLFRMLIPINGDPLITIRIRPTFNYNASEGFCTHGSNHIRYCGPKATWRVTTNAPVSSIMEEIPFLLKGPIFIIIGTDESIQSPIDDVFLDFERKTTSYWLEYVNSLNIPVDYEPILIRAAITLKMLASNDQGGLVSSLTMGIPLGPDSTPTRDERVFRAMDECLSLVTLRELGMFDVCKKLLEFFKNMAFSSTHLMCGVHSERSVPAEKALFLAGYGGNGPTYYGGIFGNGDEERNSLKSKFELGLIVVALTQVFYDERLRFLASLKLYEVLEKLTTQSFNAFKEIALLYEGPAQNQVGGFPVEASNAFECSTNGMTHVASPMSYSSGYFDDDPKYLNVWEEEDSDLLLKIEAFQRDGSDRNSFKQHSQKSSKPFHASAHPETASLGHTFTTALCWAACDKLSKLAERLKFFGKAVEWQKTARLIKEKIIQLAWNSKRNAFTTYWKGKMTGPSLLRLVEIGFIEGTNYRFIGTVAAFENDAAITATCNFNTFRTHIKEPGMSKRKVLEKLGAASTVFTTKTLLWYVEALRVCGRVDEARTLFEAILKTVNKFGVLSQSIDLAEGAMWGNFPYAPSLLGLMRCCYRLSKPWAFV